MSSEPSQAAPTLRDYAHVRVRPAPDAPLISVVTVCFNSVKTLSRTIDSVHQQAPSTEHVFIDGGSRDETLDLIRARLRGQDRLISEPDRGISDAMNKGVAAARGRYIAILHSDDWFSANQLEQGLKRLSGGGAAMAFGDVVLYADGQPWLVWAGDPDYQRTVHARMPAVPHPSLLYDRAVFERVGLYRTDLKLAMDYEWLLRSVTRGERAVYDQAIIANMTYDGASNSRYWGTLQEVCAIATSYGRPALRARAELYARFAKTSIGRQLRSLAPGLYTGLRKQLNPELR
jgi:glycosyltransferase involved in cell wall biosynthesis